MVLEKEDLHFGNGIRLSVMVIMVMICTILSTYDLVENKHAFIMPHVNFPQVPHFSGAHFIIFSFYFDLPLSVLFLKFELILCPFSAQIGI